MSRRQLFHASDLARALKVTQQAGLTITRVEIEPSGKIVVMTDGSTVDAEREEARRALDRLRKRIADERAERTAKKGKP